MDQIRTIVNKLAAQEIGSFQVRSQYFRAFQQHGCLPYVILSKKETIIAASFDKPKRYVMKNLAQITYSKISEIPRKNHKNELGERIVFFKSDLTYFI